MLLGCCEIKYNMETMNVEIADDSKLIRDRLKRMLTAIPNVAVRS
jgi:hypothetical protein